MVLISKVIIHFSQTKLTSEVSNNRRIWISYRLGSAAFILLILVVGTLYATPILLASVLTGIFVLQIILDSKYYLNRQSPESYSSKLCYNALYRIISIMDFRAVLREKEWKNDPSEDADEHEDSDKNAEED
jgi:hypothetical protein